MKTLTCTQFAFVQLILLPRTPFICTNEASHWSWGWSSQMEKLEQWAYPHYTFRIGNTEFKLIP